MYTGNLHRPFEPDRACMRFAEKREALALQLPDRTASSENTARDGAPAAALPAKILTEQNLPLIALLIFLLTRQNKDPVILAVLLYLLISA